MHVWICAIIPEQYYALLPDIELPDMPLGC